MSLKVDINEILWIFSMVSFAQYSNNERLDAISNSYGQKSALPLLHYVTLSSGWKTQVVAPTGSPFHVVKPIINHTHNHHKWFVHTIPNDRFDGLWHWVSQIHCPPASSWFILVQHLHQVYEMIRMYHEDL